MKFRISSLLLLLTIAGLAMGWLVDRQQLLANISTEREKHVLEIAETIETTRFHYRAWDDAETNPEGVLPSRLALVRWRSYESIHGLWLHRDNIMKEFGGGQFGDQYNPALKKANRLLALLDCDSTDKFFAMSTGRSTNQWWEKYHQASDAQHESLRAFIEESLKVKYASPIAFVQCASGSLLSSYWYNQWFPTPSINGHTANPSGGFGGGGGGVGAAVFFR